MAAYFNTNMAGQNSGEYTPIGIAPSGRVIGRFIKGELTRFFGSPLNFFRPRHVSNFRPICGLL